MCFVELKFYFYESLCRTVKIAVTIKKLAQYKIIIYNLKVKLYFTGHIFSFSL